MQALLPTFACKHNSMEFAGYLASLVIGLSLGLIGGGGSILTVPVLVYLFRIPPVMATAYSLFIVGSTSLIGVLPKYKQGQINIKTAIVFGIPSIFVVFVTRKFLLPLIPDNLIHLGSFLLTKNTLLMLLFALLMLFASISMIRKNRHYNDYEYQQQTFNYPLIFAEGAVVGLLTGLVGAGGGFLIIPALVLLSKLPMKQAIGTSLAIIAAKSLIGFTGDASNYEMNWSLLLFISALAVAGFFLGNWINKKISGERLKKGFGWFVLLMGLYIIARELFFPEADFS